MDLNSSPQGSSASNVNVDGSAPNLEFNSNQNALATVVIDGTNGLAEGVICNENGGAVNARVLPTTFIKPARMPYVNLFKNNRMANEQHKFGHFKKGTNRLKFTFDDVDPTEKTYGICLLGHVISGKPPTTALLELVRRWGKDVKFQTHDSGWIVFTFPSLDVRDRVLSAGPYLVYGYHLFLKEMPRCFRFREEDMNTLPSWVQIHGHVFWDMLSVGT